ncbi:RAB6A-GEF complex partner protein 2-like isoform X2 [Scylla paramamosain]|uniref:RAB6A-GEF complex partner protein 2-like isoform X2 n=1 Tax=Scylla paramamosain TaxID=85552 RepID=UPI0030830C21
MVEVCAQVLGGPVHLAGDTVQVCITVTSPSLDPALRAQSSDVCDVVAWGSAQIHCQCSVNEARVKLPPTSPRQAEEQAVTNADTSFAPCRGERGRVVLSTKPKILFCDLQLLPGESRSFVYKETLPCDAPPTYRGQLLKYAYKITIGTQRLGAPTKLLRIPIMVIVLQGLSEACVYSESGELAPSNPFLHTPQRDTPRHTALQIIQYSVTLQSEEVIAENCRQRASQKSMLVSYSKAHEVCLNLSHTHLLLPIPLHITPTFTTDLVSLQWHLHFEFVTSVTEVKGPSPLASSKDQLEWRAPTSLDIETMVWDLPITILPTTPSQVAQAICMPAQHTLPL